MTELRPGVKWLRTYGDVWLTPCDRFAIVPKYGVWVVLETGSSQEDEFEEHAKRVVEERLAESQT